MRRVGGRKQEDQIHRQSLPPNYLAVIDIHLIISLAFMGVNDHFIWTKLLDN